MKRVRITEVAVQVSTVLDDTDTDTLTPLQPVTVKYPPGDWPLFNLDHTRAMIQQQVDTELAAASPPGPDPEPASGPRNGQHDAGHAPDGHHHKHDPQHVHGG